jgi:hypothetical protein
LELPIRRNQKIFCLLLSVSSLSVKPKHPKLSGQAMNVYRRQCLTSLDARMTVWLSPTTAKMLPSLFPPKSKQQILEPAGLYTHVYVFEQ